MSLHRAAVFALVAALVAPQAFAQDDLFVPLPSKEDGKPKQKAGKKRGSKKAATAKKPPAPVPVVEDDLVVPVPQKPSTAKKPAAPVPVVEDDLVVPVPTRKPATAKKPPPTQKEDDLVVPIGGKGDLLVKVAGGVKGARLFVDNKEVGALPLSAPLTVEAGEHTVVVRRPGFADFTRRVTAQAGKPTELSVTLEAVSGVVTVASDVPGASVTINGQPRGQVPLSGLLLKPGSYEIVVSLQGYKPETKSLAVRAGRDYTVTANLRPMEGQPTVVAEADRPEKPVLTPAEPALTDTPQIPLTPEEEPVASVSQPWFKRWYVWAGVGAVVTAATVGTVMATRGGSATDLRSDPDTLVCINGCDAVLNGSGIVKF